MDFTEYFKCLHLYFLLLAKTGKRQMLSFKWLRPPGSNHLLVCIGLSRGFNFSYEKVLILKTVKCPCLSYSKPNKNDIGISNDSCAANFQRVKALLNSSRDIELKQLCYN